jgi:predicted Zn-dependent peptidase
MNALECMYNSHPIKIDVAGSVESISHITKETLYTIYDNFYTPENSVIVISGDFVPEEIIDVIKSKMIMKSSNNKVERIYPKEDRMIVRTRKEQKMDISIPMFMVGYKDNDFSGNRVKKNLAIEILLNYAYSRSSKIFNDLYEKGKILGEVSFNYEYAENYAHVLIQGQSDDIEYVINALENTLEDIKENGFDFERLESMKRKVYGELVRDNYSTVSSISTGFITDYFRGVSIFDYFEEFDLINEDYLLNLLNELFDSKNKVVSVINSK